MTIVHIVASTGFALLLLEAPEIRRHALCGVCAVSRRFGEIDNLGHTVIATRNEMACLRTVPSRLV